MAKLNAKNLKSIMQQLAHSGDRESYSDLWKAINVLWNLGLVDDRLHDAAVREDHRLFESGEADTMCDGAFDLAALDI